MRTLFEPKSLNHQQRPPERLTPEYARKDAVERIYEPKVSLEIANGPDQKVLDFALAQILENYCWIDSSTSWLQAGPMKWEGDIPLTWVRRTAEFRWSHETERPELFALNLFRLKRSQLLAFENFIQGLAERLMGANIPGLIHGVTIRITYTIFKTY